MKTPRTSDFDPKAKQHELKSSLDNFPTIEKVEPSTPPAKPETLPTVQPATHVPQAVPIRHAPKPKRAIKTRQAFDIYADQVDSLKKLSIEQQLQGEKGSMSAMVRVALDDYLKKQGTIKP